MKKETKTIWCSDIDECQRIWETDFMFNGWDVHKELKLKWNWRKFDWLFTYTVIKK